ncbi:ABC transporter family protein [Tritrichomonas foetus]|uniref:ABC transporter family protein n=1 Tax=Tritrichomonas foetus TaxID=1144522 RepID=A0A1J4KJ39_9EUKA|nr:ABC transporter family protein [Tritrichomonas foetus]|eukprot:OHT09836.1 ABC transporter family protein [Tritrichomonas foetus]
MGNSNLYEPNYLSSSESACDLPNIGSVPGGSWADRKFNYNRVLRLLFHKQFVLKLRKVSAIIEICIAFVFYFILYPLDYICQQHIVENLNPPDNYTQIWSLEIAKMFLMSNKSRLIAMLKTPQMEQMMDVFSQTYLPMTSIEVEYKDSVNNVRDSTDDTEFAGLGIIWHNSDKDDAFSHPNIEIYCQSLTGCPSAEIFRWIRWYLYLMGNVVTNYQNPKLVMAANLNSSATRYPMIEGDAMYDEAFVFMIFIIVPIIVATMPDFETILDEKDTKVAAFAFLNGCPESAYWIVSIVTPFIICFIPYLIICIIFCYWLRMTTVDFSLLLFCSVFFILSHLFFQYWISTFMKRGSAGRSFTIIMLVAALFLGIIHMYTTLTHGQRGKPLQHILSIVPFSCYQLIIGTLYNNGINKQRKIGWGNLNEDILPYPMWIGVMWILIDTILYFFLFVICNACNPRIFGTPIIKWSEIFNKNAWKRVFKKTRIAGEINNQQKLIIVKDLKKTYQNGKKSVEVFKGADFYVNEGEVIVIIGPNGEGKSTLVNILSGAIEPNAGTFEFNGSKPSKRFKALQSCLGVVFQENIIFNRLSVKEHLELWGAFKGISEENLKDSIDYYAENLQLTHMLDNYAGDLSGGQKRKLCIAMALLGNPPVVIMDEPTAGVDVQARQLIWKTIASLEKTTSLVTSHALEEAEAVSSRLFIVSNNTIPFCGSSTELRNKYQCGYLLRVERDDGTVGPVLDMVQSFIPSAHLSDERKDTISLPVNPAVAQMLQALKNQKEQLGVHSYSFTVEQLEDMLLKLIETGADLAQ